MPASNDIAEEIARLGDLTRKELIERWIGRFGHAPPKGLSKRLLELSAAYALQAMAFGGLRPALRKALEAAIDLDAGPARPVGGPAAIRPGTRLVRVWNGRTHHVEVAENGFLWNEQHYRSLSAVAREITGAHWSGPRFFGL